MTNDELIAAWRRKLPAIEPTDRDLSAFALGVETGAALAAEQPKPKRATGWAAPKGRYVPPVLFSPYTGEPRDVRDVQSDPQGVLIVPPGAAMLAAPPAAAEQPQPEAQPVAVVTECEACFTPDVCQLRGKCDHYSTDWLRVAPPPSAPQAEAPSQFARGIDAAARFVEKRLADYDAAHGSTDSDTGAREYPGTGDEYVCELAEIAEAIRGLAPPPAAEPSEAELPPLPIPTMRVDVPYYDGRDQFYTAEQMREYALRAAAAARKV